MVKVITLLLMSACSFTAMATSVDCDKAINTLEINYCAKVELDKAEAEMERYLDKSIAQHTEDTDVVESINIAQSAWQSYSKSQCDSVFTMFRDGSMRVMMTLSCRTKLTQQRTHQLWSQYLTYIDSAEPVLPEPAVLDIS
ncbi:lysozyme inhibitor LprI family protein [Moritella dasanensis]|uniref:lysozyme inhibitor LprI family protein n=1 Tax=Moritella dasanensis TaxID=428031 RepID=UPI0003728BD0|nr:lysozyme inhibitor LprI family protein [Moritella dasanensis]